MDTIPDLRKPELLALLPKSQELIEPLLFILRKVEGCRSNSEIDVAVAEYLGLPEDVITIPHVKDSRTELRYRLAWAQTYLKSIGLLQNPKKSYWQITPPDKQKEIMLEWFHSRYQDPARCCPYENKEGGYQYIWGEPVEPIDVIMAEFEGKFDDGVIDEVINELSDRNELWSPAPEYGKYFEPQSTYCEVFHNTLMEIERMADMEMTAVNREILYRMLYARIYSALEAYLCDALTYSIMEDHNALESFVTNFKAFSEQPFKMENLFGLYRNIKLKVADYLSSRMVWHRFKEAEKVYKACYNISFSTAELDRLEDGLKLRHDIVHRDGKDIQGKPIKVLNKEDLMQLIDLTSAFVEDIDHKLETAKEKAYPVV